MFTYSFDFSRSECRSDGGSNVFPFLALSGEDHFADDFYIGSKCLNKQHCHILIKCNWKIWKTLNTLRLMK